MDYYAADRGRPCRRHALSASRRTCICKNLSPQVHHFQTVGNPNGQGKRRAGNLGSLLQDGWTIEYGRYKDFEGISLPVKVTARQAEWKVKLVIKEWDLGGPGAAND